MEEALFMLASACLPGWVAFVPKGSSTANCAAAPLPSDLHYLLVFYEHGHRALAAGERLEAGASGRVGFDVVLHKLAAPKLEPLPHLPGKGAACRAEQLHL